MKNRRHRKIFSGATFVSCWFLWAAAAQDDVQTESAPPPMEAVDKHPAELQSEAQAKALAQALYSLALKQEMKDGFESALPQYLTVIKTDPHFIDLQVKIAFYFLRNHETDKALDLLQTASDANPQSGDIRAAVAFVQQTDGHLDQALVSANQALALKPDDVLAHRVRFESLEDLGRPKEALAAAQDLTKINCRDPKVWAELAHAYTEMICASSSLSKDELSALITPLYEKAFALGDPSAELLAQRADFVIFLGKTEEALKYFELASEKGDPSAELYVRVAHLYTELGKSSEAIKNYEAAYALSPEMPQLREELSYQYILNGQEDKAIVLLEAILHKTPTRAEVYSKLGDLYRQAKQLDKSEVNYREAIALDASNVVDYLKLSLLFLSEKRLNEAATILSNARTHFPSNARVAFYAAIVQRELKNSQQSLDLFAQARMLADEEDEKSREFPYPEYFCELSLAQEEAGKPQQSEATLKEGLSMDPNDENLLNALAYLWAEQSRNLPQALEFSKRSLQISPDRPEFLDTLAWVYYKEGRYQDALPLLEKAITSMDGEEDVLDHLAEVYWKLGHAKEALAALDKILAKNPDNSAIREKYEKIKKGEPLSQTSSPLPVIDTIRVLCLFTLLAIVPVHAVTYLDRAYTTDEVKQLLMAHAALLYDALTGTIIYERNIDEPFPPASTTKLMTALLVYEMRGLNGSVVIQPEDTRVEPSSVPLIPGETVTIDRLMHALLIDSDNDAALTLARYVAGSESKFIDLMNARALALGCKNTHFVNPNGLPAKNHYTTARDLRRIFNLVISIPALREICETKEYVLVTKAGTRRLTNHNRLLGLYPGMGPAKTGWTVASKHTYAAAAIRDGRELQLIILHSQDKWKDATMLFDYGFSHLPPIQLPPLHTVSTGYSKNGAS